jgi:hypothetical protein
VKSLPLADWPTADREAWRQAREPHVRLRRGGAAAHMKPVTQADLERRYGYLLDHLARRHLLDQTAPAAAHVTEEALRGFLGEIKAIWRPVTQAQSIYKLRRMAEILSPRTNFAWPRETENDLALVAYPAIASIGSSPRRGFSRPASPW